METFNDFDESSFTLFEPELNESWSKAEDKNFESILIKILPEENPKRLESISRELPWRTADQVEKRYQELVDDVNAIEAGQVPFPEYNDRNFWESLEEDERQESSSRAEKVPKQKRNPECRWTVEEHKLFLEGLDKLGNGDWRGIARHFVLTRTPSQVASHAQKYHMRKNGQGTTMTTRRRKSIHDITLDDLATQNPEQAMVPESSQNGNNNLQQQREDTKFLVSNEE